MTKERAELLGELLEEMLTENQTGYIPAAIWGPVQRAFALSYIELGIIRRNSAGKAEILLTHRADNDWTGWHIPGGLWRTRQTMDECIASLVGSEQLGPDAQVSFVGKGTWEKWHDHPYGYPISHIVICTAQGIVETGTMKWFGDVPEGMINDGGHHAEFIRSILTQAETLV